MNKGVVAKWLAYSHWAAQMETAESNAWGGFLLNIGLELLKPSHSSLIIGSNRFIHN